MTTKIKCGGCQGIGPHSSRCPSQQGAQYQRLYDLAKNLHREIGELDPTAETLAYQLMHRLKDLHRIARGDRDA